MLSKTKTFLLLVVVLVALASALSVNAQDNILTNNKGDASTLWYISGERSLVINGFDLQAFSLNAPVQVAALRIAVRKATPGVPLEAVVYQDANGGSPVDATLVGRKSVDITTPGVAVVTFDQPLTVSQRFMWVGFYMPVDFQFSADTSGTSVLTYWAWEPNGTFDVAKLSDADVLGPANGTAPVNMDMKGVARITVQLGGGTTVPAGTPVPGSTPQVTSAQIVGDPAANLTPMTAYPNCGNITYDSQDIAVTYRAGVQFHCRAVDRWLGPQERAVDGYVRRGSLFDVYVFGVPSGIEALPYAVTHCIKPPAEHLEKAIIGLAHGAPREWELLPTVRFGSVVCAEITHAGFISFFIPR